MINETSETTFSALYSRCSLKKISFPYKMLNRQDSLLSSSRRQTPPPENRRRGKSVGCMSGIFQLISKYQSRTKRLTSGGKRGKFSEDSSPAATGAANKKVTVHDQNEVTVQRSPALPPELRHRTCPENAKARPALVARLMGLEEKCSPLVVAAEGESLTEVKRKMLLKALDKCNQDLEALKKIIKAVETSSSSSSAKNGASTPPPAVETCKQKSTAEHQLLSPISVLDEQMITRSPPLSKIHDNAVHIVQRSKQAGKKAGTDDSTSCILKKFTTSSFRTKREAAATSPVMWCSKAMVQSVEEVCRDIACGEQREAGKIGLVLQDYICADLIQELVKDLGSSPCTLSLPFEACRRRLCL